MKRDFPQIGQIPIAAAIVPLIFPRFCRVDRYACYYGVTAVTGESARLLGD